VTGYEGSDCSVDVDDCLPNNPCSHGGVCSDAGLNDFVCDCAPTGGYAGTTCEIFLGCTNAPCIHGTCDDSGTALYTCTCDDGYDGTDCDNDIDDCASDCLNGATCHDGVLSFSCECADGFEGTFCQTSTAVDPCVDNECVNGDCVPSLDNDLYACVCASGYNGTLCEDEVDECESGPCGQHGDCIDEVDGFTCECDDDYTGTTCADVIDDCDPNPCLNGGSCDDGVSSYTCTCAAGHTGDNCDVAPSGECTTESITALAEAVEASCDSCDTDDGLTDACKSSLCSGSLSVADSDAACHDSITAVAACSDDSLANYVKDAKLKINPHEARAWIASCSPSSTGDGGAATFVFKPNSASSLVPTFVSAVLAFIVCLF
jgi:Notch-like protein